MLHALTLFLICQLFGEFFVRVTFIQLPGPLIGMILLLVVLFVWSKRKDKIGVSDHHSTRGSKSDHAANAILGHLSLLFVPAAGGIIQHVDLIADHTMELVLTILASTFLTLLVTVGIFRILSATRETS